MATFYEEATLRSKGTIVLYIELDNRETMIVSIEEKNPAVYTEGQVVLEPESSQKQKTTVGAPQDMKMFDRANTDE